MTSQHQPADVYPTLGGRALLVDDDPMERVVLRAALERAGFSVVEASRGLEAVRLFVESAPDLVLLDVLMPGIDGFETCPPAPGCR